MTDAKVKTKSEIVESEKPMQTSVVTSQGGMSPIIERVLNSDIPVEKLDHLLAIQERYEANEARKAYNVALSQFKNETPELIKDTHVRYEAKGRVTSYSHSSLGYALVQVTPILSKHGLSLTWRTEQDGGSVKVVARLSHELGHYEETALSSLPDQSGGKNSIQAIGSTVTYLKRYTGFAILGLESIDDDDDGQAADGMMTKEEFEKTELSRSNRIMEIINAIQGAYNSGQSEESKKIWDKQSHLDKAEMWSIFTSEWKEVFNQIGITFKEQ